MHIIDLFSFFSIDTFHRFAFFLGQSEGDLFKRSLELVIYTMLSYMIISEYRRSKRVELRYFMIAFVSLMLHRLILVVVAANQVFAHANLSSLDFFLPIFLGTLELITVVLLVNAFLFPIFRAKKININIEAQLFIISALAIGIEIFWLISRAANKDLVYTSFLGNIIFIVIQFILIIFALYYLATKKIRPFKYREKIYFAFSMYLITPLLHLINIIFFNNESLRLRLVEQPFPFVAIILFTQVIYLKLVDKAYLQEKLIISERKYMEEKELSKLKDEFVSTVSHELRTPITSIKLYLSLLKQKKFGEVTKKQNEAFETIKQENDRLAFLIDDLLSLSRLESGKEKLNLALFDLNELKNPMYAQLAKEKKLRLSYNIPENFVVNVDIDKFKQVFLNLLNNAIKFTNAGGRIEVFASMKKKEWSLRIKDTGMGIKKEHIGHLFDKFYRIGDHMTRAEGGTGLGLAIAKKIVDLHNGRIEVESEEGEGSTFSVIIPQEIKSQSS